MALWVVPGSPSQVTLLVCGWSSPEWCLNWSHYSNMAFHLQPSLAISKTESCDVSRSGVISRRCGIKSTLVCLFHSLSHLNTAEYVVWLYVLLVLSFFSQPHQSLPPWEIDLESLVLDEDWAEVDRRIPSLFGVHTCSRRTHKTGHNKEACMLSFSSATSPSKECSVMVATTRCPCYPNFSSSWVGDSKCYLWLLLEGHWLQCCKTDLGLDSVLSPANAMQKALLSNFFI